MTTREVGETLVALCREGKFREAVERLYGPEIVSIEPEGEPREYHGLDAIAGKMDWWDQNFDIVRCDVEGPWVNEPFFAVTFAMEVTTKSDGQSQVMREIAIYEVQEGKIVTERFF